MLSEAEIKQVKELYMHGKGSIQDLARIYRVEVSEILKVIDAEDLNHARIGGDMIDPSEAGPGAQMNYGGDINVPFTTN